jgi:hypothetical protein
MNGDNFYGKTYAELMAAEPAYIALKIDFKLPIDLLDFVSLFTSLESQFEQYIREKYPDFGSESRVFVKEIRPGSIEADLVTAAGLIIPLMDHALIIEDFLKRYSERIAYYFKSGGRDESASKSDLKDLLGAVSAIAHDPDASSQLSAVQYVDGVRKIRWAIKFDTKQARRAVDEIEGHRRELEKSSGSDHSRVLMVFSQSNIKNPALGMRTGERVVIEEIAEGELPLVYASQMAEEQIKHEIREADDNVYKKGFIVDVSVQMKGGRPVAYRVTNLHQVIDLPEEEKS